MREVLIDVTRLLDRGMQGRLPTGVDRVSLAYLEHFRDRARALVRFGGRWVELGQNDSRRIFDALLAPDEQLGRLARWCVGRSYVLSWRRKNRPRVLLNTGHSGLDHLDYAIQVRRRGLLPVFFLHDIIPITHPEYCRPGEAEKHHRRLDTMLAVGKGIVMNSAATRDELLVYAQQRGLTVPPHAVALLAPARLPQPTATRPLAGPYFVMLGTIEPRKNHLLLLHLWRQLVLELGDAAPRLVVIGQRGWECEQVVDILDRCPALHGFVVEKTDCDDAEMATLLHHAQALLFPSFVEGFGIPLIESMMLCVPVIASDLKVFHEIAGGIPEYLDPLDGLGWKRLILEYSRPDSARSRAQRESLSGYAAPTWEQHFMQVDALLWSLQ